MDNINNKNSQSIIDDLYIIDPSFRKHEKELETLVKNLINAKPKVNIDQTFKQNLKRKLLANLKEKEMAPKKTFNFDIFRMTKLRYGLVGVTLCAVILLPIYFFMQAADGLPTMMNGRLVYSEGVVEHLSEDGEWENVEDGAKFAKGDSVKVFGDGKAVIMLDDGSIARLNSNTELYFQDLFDDYIALENKNGDVYTRVAKSDDRVFDVLVSGSKYRALGTAYRTLNTEEVKGLVVYESSVEVILEEDNSGLVVEEGKAYYEKNNTEKIGKIVEVTSEELKSDEFVIWNAEEDQKIDDFKEHLGVLILLEEEIEKMIDVEIKETEKPVIRESTKRITTPKKEVVENTSSVRSIAVWSIGNKFVKWASDGISSQGFKVVWSKNQNPTYPIRAGDKSIYMSDPDAKSVTLNSFDGPGVYYVRVCEYLGDMCGTYSGQVIVEFGGKSR